MIRLTIRHPDAGHYGASRKTIDRLIVEDDGAGGLQIRGEDEPLCEADRSTEVDLVHQHCRTCERTIAEQIGLSDAETMAIVEWRKRKENGLSGAEIARILDKICKSLEESDHGCEPQCDRILIEVEHG